MKKKTYYFNPVRNPVPAWCSFDPCWNDPGCRL